MRALFPQFETDTARIRALIDGYKNNAGGGTDIAKHPLYVEASEQIKTLQKSNDKLQEDWREIFNLNESAYKKLADLEENYDLLYEKYKESQPTEQNYQFSPLCEHLLKAECKTLNQRDNTEITPSVMLENMFLRYMIKREACMFHQWALTREQTRAICEKHRKEAENV